MIYLLIESTYINLAPPMGQSCAKDTIARDTPQNKTILVPLVFILPTLPLPLCQNSSNLRIHQLFRKIPQKHPKAVLNTDPLNSSCVSMAMVPGLVSVFS